MVPEIHFRARLWVYSGKAAWYFITLPPEEAEKVKFYAGKRRGFGSVRVSVQLMQSQWQTSLFPDKASGSFLLPVKAAIRQKNGLSEDDECEIQLVLKEV